MDLQIEHSRYQEKLLEKSKHASSAYVKGDYEEAILLYTEALSLDPNNHVFLTNRSDVYLKTKQYELALEDGKFAAHLQPNSSKVCLFLLSYFLYIIPTFKILMFMHFPKMYL